MMRIASKARPQAVVLTVATLLLLSGAASAEELLLAKEPKRRLSAQIIADIDKPDAPRRENWFRTHLNVRKGAGFEYSHNLTVGERDLEVSVYGPVNRKRPGVGFEVRF